MAPPLTNLPASTPLSPAELSYLRTSLTLAPPIRPDSRSPTQFRPLTAETDILPTTHGSARMIWGDGGECIVGIKAEVAKTLSPGLRGGHWGGSDWIEINVEVSGQRDDDAFLGMTVAESLLVPGAGLVERLVINDRFHWKVYVDILLLTPPLSHPATLLTLTTHLALRSTRLPKLTSEGAEDPLFDDDWENAALLYPGTGEALPPITLLVLSVGGNAFFDPTREELAVGDVILAVSVCAGKIVGLRTLEGGSGWVGRAVVRNAVRESLVVADEVLESLRTVIEGG